MKSNLRLLVPLLSALTLGAPTVLRSQAVIVFSNLTPGINAPFFDTTGTNRLGGEGYQAALFVSPAGAGENNMVQLGMPQPFRTGGSAGYWISANIPLPFAPGTSIDVQVRFWDTESGLHRSFHEALEAGASTGISKVLHLTVNPTGNTFLVGLTSVGLVPVTPRLSRSMPFTWVDSMSVANGTQPVAICNQMVGTTRWLLARFAVSGEAMVSATAASNAVVAVYRRCPTTPAGCELVGCGRVPESNSGSSLVQFEIETNAVYAMAMAHPENEVGSIELNISVAARLTLAASGGSAIQLSWPSDATNHVIESTATLGAPAVWNAETNQPALTADRLTVQLEAMQPARIFRLRFRSLP